MTLGQLVESIAIGVPLFLLLIFVFAAIADLVERKMYGN